MLRMVAITIGLQQSGSLEAQPEPSGDSVMGGLASLLSSASDFPNVLMGTPREGVSHPHTPHHEHSTEDEPGSR